MNLLITGDMYISDKLNTQNIISDSVLQLFCNSDYRIINLEAPVTNCSEQQKILKTGRHLKMSPHLAIALLKELNVDLATLANNHIMDYGNVGLEETLIKLKQAEIDFTGVGKNLSDAQTYHSIKFENLKIAILNFCENEWSCADKHKSGANPLNIIDNVNQIKIAKKKHDKVICIIHGGHEYYNLPSPRMAKQYKFYIDNGADAIIGHHTHCLGGYEMYKNCPIIYSLGNFIFSINSKKKQWYNGLVVKLSVNKDSPISFELYPVEQDKDSFRLTIQNKYNATHTLSQVKYYTEMISSPELLQAEWQKYVESNHTRYLNIFNPMQLIGNRYFIGILRILKIDKWLIKKRHYSLIFNIIRCEAHRDNTLSALKFYFKKYI